jgi:hypothetical protein
MVEKAAPAIIPIKDKLSIVQNILRTQQVTKRSEDVTSKYTNKPSVLARALTAKIQQQRETTGANTSKPSELSMLFKMASLPAVENKVEQSEVTKSKFGSIKEHIVSNNVASTTLPSQTSIDKYEFDTDPSMDNNYMDINGVSKRSGIRTNQHVLDNEISPLTELTARYRQY